MKWRKDGTEAIRPRDSTNKSYQTMSGRSYPSSRLRRRLGEHLDNRADLDLTGYYKLYAAKKSIRIVYRIIDQEILVEVVAIGRREDLAAYQEALKRLKPGDRAKNT